MQLVGVLGLHLYMIDSTACRFIFIIHQQAVHGTLPELHSWLYTKWPIYKGIGLGAVCIGSAAWLSLAGLGLAQGLGRESEVTPGEWRRFV